MSRWGNFLSGIESGLDKILQENEAEKATPHSPEKSPAKATVSRNVSNRRKPDRLQERLSKAVEGRKSGESNRAQSRSRLAELPGDDEDNASARASIDIGEDGSNRPSTDTNSPCGPSLEGEDAPDAREAAIPKASTLGAAGAPFEDGSEATQRPGVIIEAKETPELSDQFYLERIEALQAKLNLLIKEAADKAETERKEAGEDTEANKFAQQTERIALLMAEGQKLSEKELKHVGTIRRLHSRTIDLEFSLNQAKKAESSAQKQVQSLSAKVEAAAEAQKSAASNDEAKATLLRQIEQVKKQNETQVKELASLRGDLERARANNGLREQYEQQKQQLEAERRKVSDLREELDNSKIERELSAGRQKSQLEEQRIKAVQAQERAAAREAELESEIKALESGLETIRTRREQETGGTVEQQAKQLRQIEALQRQYSVSKENWGSVEASLNSRIASLETERDELAKKEGELRRKLRDATSSSRRREEEIEEIRTARQELEDKLQSRRTFEETTISDLRIQLKASQKELDEGKEEIQDLKASLTTRSEAATPTERADEGASFNNSNGRFQSPSASRTRSPVATQGDLKDRRHASAIGLFPSNGVFVERPPSSRKVSIASPHISSSASFRQHAFQLGTRSSSRSAMRESNSLDEGSDGLRTPATPGRGFNDVVSASASNPAAGPSVQLVERMSATVRRLESEKTAIRDELDRMSSVLDEARSQMVSLLEEAESKRALEKKVSELEVQVAETSKRHQTTLELLGEKSEAVEELRADIADMKQIYRETLERSMK